MLCCASWRVSTIVSASADVPISSSVPNKVFNSEADNAAAFASNKAASAASSWVLTPEKY